MEGKKEFLYYVNIYKNKSFELDDTTVEAKVQLCKKLLSKQQRVSISHNIAHWTLWNQTVKC